MMTLAACTSIAECPKSSILSQKRYKKKKFFEFFYFCPFMWSIYVQLRRYVRNSMPSTYHLYMVFYNREEHYVLTYRLLPFPSPRLFLRPSGHNEE